MGSHKTVTISTDGLRDYVTLPNGLKLLVGQVGMSKLVAECSRDGRDARRALDEYLKTGEAVLALDLDRLSELTAPPKNRWATANDSPSIRSQDRTSTTDRPRRAEIMANDTAQADKAIQDAIKNQCYRIEQQIALISQHASEASPGSIGQDMQKDQVAKLKDLVQWLRRGSPYGNQSDNATYYGLGGSARSKEATDAVVTENNLIADATLSKVEATSNKIDLLVASGKRFDHVRAKGDLYKVATGVQGILKADLGAPEVKAQLSKLAEQAQRLHGVFARASV